jgi:hypothetical protein
MSESAARATRDTVVLPRAKAAHKEYARAQGPARVSRRVARSGRSDAVSRFSLRAPSAVWRPASQSSSLPAAHWRGANAHARHPPRYLADCLLPTNGGYLSQLAARPAGHAVLAISHPGPQMPNDTLAYAGLDDICHRESLPDWPSLDTADKLHWNVLGTVS